MVDDENAIVSHAVPCAAMEADEARVQIVRRDVRLECVVVASGE